jgi:hypothetical protein
MADPESLVAGRVRRYGRFAERPASVNPLDEITGVNRMLRRPLARGRGHARRMREHARAPVMG